MATKETLIKLLKQNVLEVDFEKRNGEARLMLCSLKKQLIPVVDSDSNKKPTKRENNHTVVVWDLEKNGFRSFKLDSIRDYRIVTEGYEL